MGTARLTASLHVAERQQRAVVVWLDADTYEIEASNFKSADVAQALVRIIAPALKGEQVEERDSDRAKALLGRLKVSAAWDVPQPLLLHEQLVEAAILFKDESALKAVAQPWIARLRRIASEPSDAMVRRINEAFGKTGVLLL